LGLLALSGSFLLLLLLARYLGFSLLDSYSRFAATINQGDFNEGYLVFFDYLWRAEQFMALIWLGSLLTFCWLVRSCPTQGQHRGLTWAATIVALVAILIVGSNVLGKFVVYGRLARQVAPFCALLVGWTAARLFGPGGARRRLETAALTVVVAAGAWSMATPLRMEFPPAFYKRAAVAMTAYQAQHAATEATAVANSKFRFLYNSFVWPYPAEGPLPRHYLVLLASPHPLSWRPYLYEGFNRAQRNKMEATDISMRLVLLQD
jgi:signal transduction histidine kinase